MATEIERKFLVNRSWVDHKDPDDRGTMITQGYLSLDPERVVRVRIATNHNTGVLSCTWTAKGKKVHLSAKEIEYPITYTDAEELLSLCIPGSIIEKYRYRIPHHIDTTLTYEVDSFRGAYKGLVIAELELPFDDYVVLMPNWIQEDVTHETKYANSAMALRGVEQAQSIPKTSE